MAANVKSAKMMKVLKRLGFIGLVISVFVIIVTLIISFLPRSNNAFSIQIDTSSKPSHFRMTTNPDILDEEYEEDSSDFKNYFQGDPLTEAKLTFAARVERYLDSLDEKASGSLNFVENDIQKAIVYTLFIKNTSMSEDQIVNYAVEVNNRNNDKVAQSFPVEYFRVLARTQIYGSRNVTNTYYGNKITKVAGEDESGTIYYQNALGNDRDAISGDYQVVNGKTVIAKGFESSGNDGYCINFVDYRTGYIVQSTDDYKVHFIIPAGKVMKFTFVGYFEGNDKDSDIPVPDKASLQLTLHFGVE